jgi:hypothetical protein
MACGGTATKLEGRFASDENADIRPGKFIADHDKTMIVTIAALPSVRPGGKVPRV